MCFRYRATNGSPQPKFLTKEQRAQLAIEKRSQELREQKEKEERARKEREALEREAEEIRTRERDRERSAHLLTSLLSPKYLLAIPLLVTYYSLKMNKRIDEVRMMNSLRLETPEPESRQGRRNAKAAGVQLLDTDGAISLQVLTRPLFAFTLSHAPVTVA